MTATFGLEEELGWARTHMVRVRRALDDLPRLAGVRLACSIHLDLKMVPLLEGLLAKGSKLFVTTCNPDTVRDEVAEHLRSAGADVEAWHGMPQDGFRTAVEDALDWAPTHLCEMGAELTAALCRREAGAPPCVRASRPQAPGSRCWPACRRRTRSSTGTTCR